MIHSEEKRDTKCLKEVRDSLILRQSKADGEIKKTLVHSSNSFSRLMCAFRFSVKMEDFFKLFRKCGSLS